MRNPRDWADLRDIWRWERRSSLEGATMNQLSRYNECEYIEDANGPQRWLPDRKTPKESSWDQKEGPGRWRSNPDIGSREDTGRMNGYMKVSILQNQGHCPILGWESRKDGGESRKRGDEQIDRFQIEDQTKVPCTLGDNENGGDETGSTRSGLGRASSLRMK